MRCMLFRREYLVNDWLALEHTRLCHSYDCEHLERPAPAIDSESPERMGRPTLCEYNDALDAKQYGNACDGKVEQLSPQSVQGPQS